MTAGCRLVRLRQARQAFPGTLLIGNLVIERKIIWKSLSVRNVVTDIDSTAVNTAMVSGKSPAALLEAAIRQGKVRRLPEGTQLRERNARSFVQQYDAASYSVMARDPHRMAAFREAIGRSAFIRDAIGVDVGAGRDALLAQMCVRAGARKVYAIEANESAARLAAELVARLGLQDKIIVIHAWAQDLPGLPEPADFLVQEVLGEVASVEGVIAVVAHAKRFFLNPDAVENCIPVAARTLVTGSVMPSLDIHCIAGPRERIVLAGAAVAMEPEFASLTSSIALESLTFASPPAKDPFQRDSAAVWSRRSERRRRSSYDDRIYAPPAREDGEELSAELSVSCEGVLATLRMHMEFLPCYRMNWRSSLAPFSHWHHVHATLDQPVAVKPGDIIRVRWKLCETGGVVLLDATMVSSTERKLSQLLHLPLVVDPSTLHAGAPGPVPHAAAELPVVVMATGDACWAPGGIPALIVGYHDGQDDGRACYLLEPVDALAGSLGWVNADDVVDWRLGGVESHPLAAIMVSEGSLPEELCRRAAVTVNAARVKSAAAMSGPRQSER